MSLPTNTWISVDRKLELNDFDLIRQDIRLMAVDNHGYTDFCAWENEDALLYGETINDEYITHFMIIELPK